MQSDSPQRHTPASSAAAGKNDPLSLAAAVLSQLAEGVIVTDAWGRILFVNEAAARMHGVARLDVPPEQYSETYHLLTEDGRPYPSTELPLARAVLRGETVVEERWRIRRPDGTEIFAVGTARPITGPAGERLGAVLTLRDDTHRVEAERAERRAALVLDQIADQHLTMDAEFRILSVNRAALRTTGLPAEALIGRTHWEAFPASVGTAVERQYRRVVEEQAEVHLAHHYVGEGFDSHIEIDAYPTEAGGVAVFWREVSARVLAEAELRTQNDQLAEQALELEMANQQLQDIAAELEARTEEAERQRAEAEAANLAKSQFLTTMSHELRTPLNAIGGYTDLLLMGLRGALTDAQRSDLERVQHANQYLTSLVNDVLNFARLDAGGIEYRPTDFDLAAIIADLEPLIGPQIAARGLTFDHDACAPDTPGRPHRVHADPEKLRQILLNLLTNAMKFTGPGGRVAVQCETDAAAGVARIRVSDTGRGIAPDQLERIFEPFVQVERNRTHESQQGVGLGLAISRDLARGMSGSLTGESRVGVGSTFIVTLPLA